MPLRANLLADIRATLGPSINPSLTTGSAHSDIYEAYLFSLVLRAAEGEGATVRFRCIGGGHPAPFVFRTSPGYINSTHRNYGFAEITFPRCPTLEAHVGVRVSGHSGVLHECDVSVLFQTEAEICRNQPPDTRVAPRSHKVVIAVEAKYYHSSINLHLGRGFLGLGNDLSAEHLFFIMNREAESVEKLLAHKKRGWDSMITPANPDSVDRVRHVFRDAFKNFKAKHRR